MKLDEILKRIKRLERYKQEAEKLARKAEKHGLGPLAERVREDFGITKPFDINTADQSAGKLKKRKKGSDYKPEPDC
jgi:hypothetical protein